MKQSSEQPQLNTENPEGVVKILNWLEQKKFAGYSDFRLMEDGKTIHCVSRALDGTRDYFIGVEFAELARSKNWTYEQTQEYWSKEVLKKSKDKSPERPV